jgi:hypothetical protein
LREVLEEQLRPFLSDLAEFLATEVETRVSGEIGRQTSGLNVAVRRMRQARGFAQLAAALADASAPYCERAAVFEKAGAAVKLSAARGVSGVLEISLPEAFRTAFDTGDPVTALAAPGEVSAAVMEAFTHTSGERVTIFPMGEAGFLYAWGGVEEAPLELLAQVAGALAPRPQTDAPNGLIAIAPAPSPAAPGWMALDPVEQRIHLRAQQFARTEAAKIRLYRAEEVKEGRRSADLYGVLSGEIDALRDAFREKFVAACPSMVDYVHLELLRTLANDDPAVLGSEYPGPLV